MSRFPLIRGWVLRGRVLPGPLKTKLPGERRGGSVLVAPLAVTAVVVAAGLLVLPRVLPSLSTDGPTATETSTPSAPQAVAGRIAPPAPPAPVAAAAPFGLDRLPSLQGDLANLDIEGRPDSVSVRAARRAARRASGTRIAAPAQP